MTPLILIVGFLGSGKTTLMRELVPRLKERGLRPHIVLNDFQNARVDAGYFEDLAETVAPISGSCVCCDSFEELIRTLQEQQLGDESILLLEANGTTDSMELVEQLSLRPECARYTMPIQVSLVDAKRWQDRSWHDTLEREQVSTANYLRVTWLDTVCEERLQEVREQLNEQAPSAKVVEIDALIEVLVSAQREALAWPPRRLSALEGHGEDHSHHQPGDAHDHQRSHDHGRYHFASWEHPLPGEIDPKLFSRTLKDLPREVLRCKGVVRLTQPKGRFIFQKVGNGELLATPLDNPVGIEPMIIFIGASLPVGELRSRIQTLDAKATA